MSAKKLEKIRQNYHFSPYILYSDSIWSLYFDNKQFGLGYFQLIVNLIHTVNSLIENFLGGKQFALLLCLILKYYMRY